MGAKLVMGFWLTSRYSQLALPAPPNQCCSAEMKLQSNRTDASFLCTAWSRDHIT
jgi:hypothetical protein